jgi:uracil-DNA glycosylase
LTTSFHDLFTAYLQSRFRLGERELALSPKEVAVLRAYRRPGMGDVAKINPPSPVGSPASAAKTAGVVVGRGLSTKAPSAHEKVSQSLSPAAPRFSRPPTEPIPPVRLELPEGDKPSRLDFIASKIRGDEACRVLFQRHQNMVFGVGDPDARIFFVGEAPGVEEDEQGEPFVGPSGQLLTKMIVAMGLKRSEVYIANICKFRPDMPVGATGNRKPTSAEMSACLPYIRAQIEVVSPRVIVALGATAVEGLFALPRAPIMQMRGQWMEWEGIPVMPTFHPSYLLRSESMIEKRKVWEDLMGVMDKCGIPTTDKQRKFFQTVPAKG